MEKKIYKLNDIKSYLPAKYKVFCENKSKDNYFLKISTLSEADDYSLVFIDHLRKDKQKLCENTSAGFIICDFDIIVTEKLKGKVIIQVDYPKLIFSIIGNALFVERPKWGIHPTAFIHPDANVHPETYIGAFTYVGKSKIRKGTIIYGNCYIYDNVEIKSNAIIHSGTVLGSDGFGYNRLETEVPIQFPHVGNIIIEDYVEIGANTTVDVGSLGTTEVGYATKIDNLVHIGHNVKIGRCCYIAAQSAIAGSTVIGDYVEIWMGCKIANNMKIGNRSSIGIGSVVIKPVSEKKKVFGNPGRVYSEK